jgi:hypothetical protein
MSEAASGAGSGAVEMGLVHPNNRYLKADPTIPTATLMEISLLTRVIHRARSFS